LLTLRVKPDISVRILTFGATVHSLICPDRHGVPDDILVGPDDPRDHMVFRDYFGSTVGRVANRVANAEFWLDGCRHKLDVNESPHHLHGGICGLDRKAWRILSVSEGERAEVRLGCVSRDGEGGYPGELAVEALFSLSADGRLDIIYTARTTLPTLCSLTNHNMYNLSGSRSDRSIRDHVLSICADHFLPVGPDLIPTGDIRRVSGSRFDFQRPVRLDDIAASGGEEQLERAAGLDHSFILTPAQSPGRPCAILHDPVSGRRLQLRTNSPALQVYTGAGLSDRIIGKRCHGYAPWDGVCLEPQGFPNAANEAGFPSIRLDPDQTYRNEISLEMSVED
jgi:aldose 1-epimerase